MIQAVKTQPSTQSSCAVHCSMDSESAATLPHGADKGGTPDPSPSPSSGDTAIEALPPPPPNRGDNAAPVTSAPEVPSSTLDIGSDVDPTSVDTALAPLFSKGNGMPAADGDESPPPPPPPPPHLAAAKQPARSSDPGDPSVTRQAKTIEHERGAYDDSAISAPPPPPRQGLPAAPLASLAPPGPPPRPPSAMDAEAARDAVPLVTGDESDVVPPPPPRRRGVSKDAEGSGAPPPPPPPRGAGVIGRAESGDMADEKRGSALSGIGQQGGPGSYGYVPFVWLSSGLVVVGFV